VIFKGVEAELCCAMRREVMARTRLSV